MKCRELNAMLVAVASLLLWARQAAGQLPEDMQRELNQNLEQQARLQALRHQQQLRASKAQSRQQQTPKQQQKPTHDPNNYSFEQVSPPVQYSYYQPYGDAANQQQPQQQQQQQQRQPAASQRQAVTNFDLNNMNFDIPPPPPAPAPVQPAPPAIQFTGAGGLPTLPQARQGTAPPLPVAAAQQGPPLTEADFRDITEGQNYGAGAPDFGLNSLPGVGEAGGGGQSETQAPQSARRLDSTDAQLAAMGLGDVGVGGGGSGGGGGGGGNPEPRGRTSSSDGLTDNFGDYGNFGNPMQQQPKQQPQRSQSDFDFAGMPSSPRDRAGPAGMGVAGGAPNSLQTLFGPAGFPGLGSGSEAQNQNGNQNNENYNPNNYASNANDPQTQRSDDGAMDIADLGDRSDQFSGADLGGFEQPAPAAQDGDFNYDGTGSNSQQRQQRQNNNDPFSFAAAAAEPQPSIVPYPDGAPQPVGTLWALTQPQSLSQARYSPLPDKGTFQQYPAYERSDGVDPREAVRAVVAATPPARPAGLGRYGWVANGGS